MTNPFLIPCVADW